MRRQMATTAAAPAADTSFKSIFGNKRIKIPKKNIYIQRDVLRKEEHTKLNITTKRNEIRKKTTHSTHC